MINKSSIFNRAKYFSSGIFQYYLVIIPAKKCINCHSSTTWVDLWKSNKMSEKNIENIAKSDSNFAPIFVDHHLLLNIYYKILYFYPVKCNKSIYFLHS